MLYFVSFAIPETGLKRMLTEARRYDIPAVLRGMVRNDIKATADAVMSLVVYCQADHDVIHGNQYIFVNVMRLGLWVQLIKQDPQSAVANTGGKAVTPEWAPFL